MYNEMKRKKLTIWLISVMGTFGVGDGVWLFFLGSAGGVMGWTFTLHSFEFRFGDILAGKLSVFVHCDKLRTIFGFLFLFGFLFFKLLKLRHFFIHTRTIFFVLFILIFHLIQKYFRTNKFTNFTFKYQRISFWILTID